LPTITDKVFLYHHPFFSSEKFGETQWDFRKAFGGKRAVYCLTNWDTPHFEIRGLLEFLLSDEALDNCPTDYRPNIGLWSSHFISKTRTRARNSVA